LLIGVGYFINLIINTGRKFLLFILIWNPCCKKVLNGIKGVKNYHFKKGSYVVGVDYQISNKSNQTIPVKSVIT
jgi:hypothetical protein